MQIPRALECHLNLHESFSYVNCLPHTCTLVSPVYVTGRLGNEFCFNAPFNNAPWLGEVTNTMRNVMHDVCGSESACKTKIVRKCTLGDWGVMVPLPLH